VSAWRDPSPHRSGFVAANGVRLQYLDWGGSGEPLVFLPGLGATAHYFDDFAPRFRDEFHVYALTLRGHGESDKPPSGYTPDTLSRDIVGALDALRLSAVHLAGHSISGDVLTRVATDYPARLRSVVYIDAAYDRSPESVARANKYIAGLVAESSLVQPAAADSVSPAALAAWYRRARRQNIPEAELRAELEWSAAGRPLRDRLPDSVASQYLANNPAPDYRRVRTPALAVYAGRDSVACGWPSTAMRHASAVRRYFDEEIKPQGERDRAIHASGAGRACVDDPLRPTRAATDERGRVGKSDARILRDHQNSITVANLPLIPRPRGRAGSIARRAAPNVRRTIPRKYDQSRTRSPAFDSVVAELLTTPMNRPSQLA
jgi:pimeloyl-ACP methyl ester carboxylesterase